MAKRPETIDAYLATLPQAQRAALQKLRMAIRSAAPDAEECISYRIPVFKRHGMLVGFNAASDHLTFHLMSTGLLKQHAKELAKYTTGRGSIQFQPEKPLPATLVRRLVKARIAEKEAAQGQRRKRRSV